MWLRHCDDTCDVVDPRGLDGALKINKFRVSGNFSVDTVQDVLNEFFCCTDIMSLLEVSPTWKN